jgi:intergrase/recombinase
VSSADQLQAEIEERQSVEEQKARLLEPLIEQVSSGTRVPELERLQAIVEAQHARLRMSEVERLMEQVRAATRVPEVERWQATVEEQKARLEMPEVERLIEQVRAATRVPDLERWRAIVEEQQARLPNREAQSRTPKAGDVSVQGARDTRSDKRDKAIRLLRSWRGEDDTEHEETWEYLRRALDEDRLSNRKLFP